MLFYWGDLTGKGAAELLCGDASLMEGGGVDEVVHGFGLREIEAAGEEGSLGEFAGFGEAGSSAKALTDKEIEDDWRAVRGDFHDVFRGVGVRFLEVCDYGLVESLAGVVEDFGEAGLGGG